MQWDTRARTPLIVGLIMNFFWVPLFTVSARASLVLLTGMIIVTVKTIYVLDAQNAYIFSPYLMWISFAWTLNAYLAVRC